MTNTRKFALALALAVAAIVAVAVGGKKDTSSLDAVALPSSEAPRTETPVRATKGDRLQVRSQIRMIAGVTLVLRNFDRAIR